jgi:hypothetical protein
MGGNARSDNYARGVLFDLFARALYLDDGATRLCIISLDLLGLWEEEASRIRTAVSEALGIPFANVTVCSTHTHSGPDTFQTLCWNEDKLQRDNELLKPFWESLPGQVVEAAGRARDAARECSVYWGTTQNHDIANNRRLRMKSGETVMNWELPPAELVDRPWGPIDPQVSAVLFRTSSGQVVGGFVHYSCHPAILAGANMQLSGDFVGFAMDQLERDFSSPAMLFLHGAAGNVNHIDYKHPERGRDAAEVHRCADSLAASARQISQHLVERSTTAPMLAIVNDELLIPIREIPEERVAAAKQILANYDGHDLSMPDGVPPELNARRTLKLAEAKRTGKYPGRFGTMRDGRLLLPLQLIRIGDVVIGTVPGEIFVEFGLEFRRRLAEKLPHTQLVLMAGLTNGLVNYIPTPEAFAQGGYEPGLGPNYLPDDAGEQIVDRLVKMATDYAASPR